MTRLERQLNGNAGGAIQHTDKLVSGEHGREPDDARHERFGRPEPAPTSGPVEGGPEAHGSEVAAVSGRKRRGKSGPTYLASEIAAAAGRFRAMVEASRSLVAEHTPIDILSAAEGSRLLSELVNRPGTPWDGATGSGMNWRLALSELEAERSHLRLDGEPVILYSLLSPPGQGHANLIRDLYCLDATMTVLLDWRPWTVEAARRRIRSAQRHYFSRRYSMMSHAQDTQGAVHVLEGVRGAPGRPEAQHRARSARVPAGGRARIDPPRRRMADRAHRRGPVPVSVPRPMPLRGVKTTRGVVSRHRVPALLLCASAYPLARRCVAASRPARALPDGPHRPWRERPPSPKARYGIAASVFAHPRPSCLGSLPNHQSLREGTVSRFEAAADPVADRRLVGLLDTASRAEVALVPRPHSPEQHFPASENDPENGNAERSYREASVVVP